MFAGTQSITIWTIRGEIIIESRMRMEVPRSNDDVVYGGYGGTTTRLVLNTCPPYMGRLAVAPPVVPVLA